MVKPPRTHCKRGHEFTPRSTYVKKTRTGTLTRQCAICRKAAELAWRTSEARRKYHREWVARKRRAEYLYSAIKDNGRECLEPVL